VSGYIWETIQEGYTVNMEHKQKVVYDLSIRAVTNDLERFQRLWANISRNIQYISSTELMIESPAERNCV